MLIRIERRALIFRHYQNQKWDIAIWGTLHFTEIHRNSLRKTEYILNRTITKFYYSDDVNTTTAELRQTKTRPISFYVIDNLLYETKVTSGDKI